MAVTTGTTWDILLDQSARTASPAHDRVSARAAYQEALYGRAALVDIRGGEVRARQGAISAALRPVVVPAGSLGHWLRASYAPRVLLITDPAAPLPEIGSPGGRVAVVDGGYPGWTAAGMPTQST